MTNNGDTERDLISQIHATSAKACLVITGAGTSAIAALFAVAGASRTIIDVQVPYASAALDAYVGSSAEQHVSKHEAVIMAVKAYKRAIALSETADEVEQMIGLSCTAAIATDRLRRGENRAHITWHNGIKSVTYSIVMHKGMRDRAGEEALCKTIILNALAEACGLQAQLDIQLAEDEIVERVVD